MNGGQTFDSVEYLIQCIEERRGKLKNTSIAHRKKKALKRDIEIMQEALRRRKKEKAGKK